MGPDLVFLIPIVAVLSIASIFLAHSPIAKALASRARVPEPDPELQAALEEQAARLMMAEDEIQRLSERLDFTERLLTDRPASTAASGGSLPHPDADNRTD